jgi:hypothetical protein
MEEGCNNGAEAGWGYAAASVIGTSHQKSPEGVCQDAHAFQFVEGLDVLVGVVSDGAGSSSQSQIGSRDTCDFVLKSIAKAAPEALFTPALAADVLERLRGELDELATAAAIPVREFACTLLVAIVGREKAAFWQIGDGAICFRERGADDFAYAFWPEKGDYANVTFFVTDANAADHLDVDVAEFEIVELAMFTDGLERLVLNFATGDVHSPFFRKLFPVFHALPGPGYSAKLSAQMAIFLDSKPINERTDDDKTLFLACRAV